MVLTSDVITVILSTDTLEMVRAMAKKAEIGGCSRIRDPLSRAEALSDDQLVGQLGECALSIHLFGDASPYVRSREIKNLCPTAGDEGSDLYGGNVDVKTSLMRSSPDPLDYRLLVRPREKHPGVIYYLAMVPTILESEATVKLVGWTKTASLPQEAEKEGPFAGAYVVSARDLNPIPPFRWKLGSLRSVFAALGREESKTLASGEMVSRRTVNP